MTRDRNQTLIDLALSGAANLRVEFKGIYSEETIRRFLEESANALKDCQVTDYLPIFAYRFARERLTAMAQVAGTIPKDRSGSAFRLRPQRRAKPDGGCSARSQEQG